MLLRHYLERGVSKTELSRRFGVSRRTIHEWIETGQLERDLEGGGTRYRPRPGVEHKLDRIGLRNNRRLQAAMRSSRLPAVKTLGQFDFAFQPSIKREQIESLHELGFVDRAENVILLGPPSRAS